MKLKVYKETSLPNELTTDSLYFVTGQGEYVDLFITGNTQGVVKRVISSNDIVTLIDEKVDQVDLETAEQQIELNRLAILTKADIAALAMLAQLVDTKADQAYVNQQITTLVGSAPEALNTVYELAAAIQDNAGIIGTLNQSVANRVRFDVATQALTEIQKQNARTNIGAETLGTAAQLVSQITAASIGAATAAQGSKADTALQSVDVAPVALSGLFSSLSGQNKIFDVVFGAYALGSNAAVVATDTLGQIIGKLQAQINNIGSSGGGGGSVTWVDVKTIGTLNSIINNSYTKIEVAKIDGMLWLRGVARITSDLTGNIFTVTNSSYFLTIKRPPAFGAFYDPTTSDTVTATFKIGSSWAISSMPDAYILVYPSGGFKGTMTPIINKSVEYIVIPATPIGQLLTP